MSNSCREHIVVAVRDSWGHEKPASSLICKIVRRKSVYVTFIVAASHREKVLSEINLRFEPGTEDALKAMIRVVGVETEPRDMEAYMLQKNIVETCNKLIKGESIAVIPESEEQIVNVRPPSLYILDYMLRNYRYDTLGGIRKATNGKVPIYAYVTGGAITTFYYFAPENLGGHGDLAQKLRAIEHLDEKERKDEAMKLFLHVKKELIKLPGLPPMYDNEFLPQKLALDIDFTKVAAFCHRFLSECDGVVLNSNTDFEQPAIDAWKNWYATRPVISPGPSDYPLTEREKQPPATKTEITKFLDAALEKYGPCSVFYISFGSTFWPFEAEKIWAIIDILLERNIPFLFSHASPFGAVPSEIIDKIKESDSAYESKWLPQDEILQHEACGWFVSHCGHNSLIESLCAGVPIIAWPIIGDQPFNAAYISAVHNLGYELFEVRSGYGTLPIARLNDYAPVATIEAVRSEFNEILTKAQGDDGKEKRKNVQKFQQKIAESWKPDGTCWKEIDRIVEVAHSHSVNK